MMVPMSPIRLKTLDAVVSLDTYTPTWQTSGIGQTLNIKLAHTLKILMKRKCGSPNTHPIMERVLLVMASVTAF